MTNKDFEKELALRKLEQEIDDADIQAFSRLHYKENLSKEISVFNADTDIINQRKEYNKENILKGKLERKNLKEKTLVSEREKIYDWGNNYKTVLSDINKEIEIGNTKEAFETFRLWNKHFNPVISKVWQEPQMKLFMKKFFWLYRRGLNLKWGMDELDNGKKIKEIIDLGMNFGKRKMDFLLYDSWFKPLMILYLKTLFSEELGGKVIFKGETKRFFSNLITSEKIYSVIDILYGNDIGKKLHSSYGICIKYFYEDIDALKRDFHGDRDPRQLVTYDDRNHIDYGDK